MQAKNKTTTGPLLLRIALILLCMTLFSTSMLSGLYAKYIAKNDGNDDARVATFEVDVDGNFADGITVNASQGDLDGTYTFSVENNSEVAITYDLLITFEVEPSFFDIALSNPVGTDIMGILDGNTITFRVTAFDEKGKIGEGTHKRAIVTAQRFLDKTYAKL